MTNVLNMENERLSTLLQEPDIAYSAETSAIDLVGLSRKGIKKSALSNLSKALAITMKQLAKLLPVTERTLQRRAANSLLNSTTSQQVILLGQLITKGEEIFGDQQTFQKWVKQPNTALGGYTPLNMMDTTIGIQLVTDVLGRIEHGVYS